MRMRDKKMWAWLSLIWGLIVFGGVMLWIVSGTGCNIQPRAPEAYHCDYQCFNLHPKAKGRYACVTREEMVPQPDGTVKLQLQEWCHCQCWLTSVKG